MAVASICVPRRSPSVLLSLWETLQDHQVGLTQAPLQLLPECWDLGVCENLHVPFKSGVSVSYSPPALL